MSASSASGSSFDRYTTRTEDDTIPLTIEDEAGAATDITGWTLTYRAKRSYGDSDSAPAIGPLTTTAGDIVLADQTADTGQATLTIPATAKAALSAPCVLRHELIAADANGDVRRAFYGTLRVDEGVTRGS